jgi:hypothetical protein
MVWDKSSAGEGVTVGGTRLKIKLLALLASPE